MPRRIRGMAVLLFLSGTAYGAPQAADATDAAVPLLVHAGAPLRLYVTKRFKKKQGTAVTAKLIEPVYAFDREVIPAGTEVTGMVSRAPGVPKWERIRAIIRGDFTPYKIPMVEFDSLLLPDGRKLTVHTAESGALNSIYVERKKKPAPAPARTGIKGRVKEQVNARIQSVTDAVRTPNKKERLEDLALSKLPYHPQYVRTRTRIDAELTEELSFGTETVTREAAAALGSQPAPDSVVAARLLTAVDSGSAKQSDSVEAVLTQPLFDASHKLVLPEGTLLKGAVVVANRARWFHRGGKLRFNFLDVELPPEVAQLRAAPGPQMRTQAILQAAEADGKGTVKVDGEGGVKATEPKTRLLAPIISLWASNRAADNDAVRTSSGVKTGTLQRNTGGRILGGGLGFGLMGTAISQSSRYVGMAFGYYGLAWSVFQNVIARGNEVHFDKNAVFQIKFGGRAAKPEEKSK
jgi:hypothetical protein